jgi:hypothetical protein
MSFLNVENCSECGRVHQKNLRNLCNDCMQLQNGEYEACYNYLRTNRKATNQELSSATGVMEQKIIAWIKEKRLSAVDYPNLTYPCNSCGDPIHNENLCLPCRSRLANEIRELKFKDQQVQGTGFRSKRN